MLNLNVIPEEFETRKKILTKLRDAIKDYKEPEMIESESAFLSGLLKSKQPVKILEVSVAKGGTTSIILQTLEDIGKPYKMYSVDLSVQCYSFKKERTGYIAAFAKENNLLITSPQTTLCGEHKFYLGKYLPQVIDEIGGDIDFVILDTVHYMPGELLDFPVMLPYLNDGAIVVLHDVVLNQRNFKYHNPDAYATGLLLSTVVAPEKFLNSTIEDKNQPFNYPNIGAFRIDKQTREHIENVFMSLLLTWKYLLKDDEVKIYRDFYAKHYSAELLAIFNEAVRLNKNNVAFKKAEATPAENKSNTVEILTYQTHVSKKGWGKWINENRISNPLTDKLDIQAIKINFPNHKIYYKVYYNEKEGWSAEIMSPEMAGTTGKFKPIYGMRVRLDEATAKEFDIFYRMHKIDGDWTPWAKNCEALYSHGQKLNSIQIKLEPKTI